MYDENFVMDMTTLLSIRMPTDLIETVKKQAKKKKKNLSAHLRYLIELGLRIDDLSDTPNPAKKLEALSHKSAIEAAMLSRATILIHNNELSDAEKKNILASAAKDAQETVMRYLGKDVFEDKN